MNRRSINIAAIALFSLASVSFAGSPASPNGHQVSKDRSDIKADASKSAADEKEVKQLNGQFNQAAARSRQAHDVYMQKVKAREAAVKSYGAKDPRAEQAVKDEAAAKQEWETRMKEQKDIAAQRKAAIDKLHGADTSYSNDVHKLDADEGQGHSKPKPAPPKNQ
jgi:hypothetical protein